MMNMLKEILKSPCHSEASAEESHSKNIYRKRSWMRTFQVLTRMTVLRVTFVSFLFLLLTSLFPLIPQAFAGGEGNIGAYPTNYDVSNPKTKSWFIYELKPGETKEDSITVVNNSD